MTDLTFHRRAENNRPDKWEEEKGGEVRRGAGREEGVLSLGFPVGVFVCGLLPVSESPT